MPATALPEPQPLQDSLPAPEPISTLPTPQSLTQLPAPTPIQTSRVDLNTLGENSTPTATPQPTAQAARSNPLIPSDASIGARTPSVWERITNSVTAGIPQFSSRTAYSPKYGQAQLLSPEEAMTPVEQERHPILTATGEMAGGFTSPESAAFIAATGGLGEIGGAAGKVIPRLISGGFALQQVYEAAKQYPEIRKAIASGDINRAEYLLTRAGLQVGMAALGARHALKGKSLRAQAAEPEPEAAVETHPIPPDEPLAQHLKEPAPHVRIVDSSAAKADLLNADTLADPTRVFHGTTANVEDVTQLDPTKSRDGAAGVGIYLSESGSEAARYAGPAEGGTGGKVLGGELSSKARLLDGSNPLPDTVREKLRAEYPDINPNLPYIDMLAAARKGEFGPEVTAQDVQRAVQQFGNYDGVRYEHVYSDGPRKALMLFRNSADLLHPAIPTMARIVSEDHVPVISRTEIAAETVQRMIDNSRELQKIGVDPEKIQSREDVEKMLDSAADHIEQNLDPRAGAVLTFDLQKSLAQELGMTVEDLLSRRSGTAFSAEKIIAARALLYDSGTNAMNLGRVAAMGDESYLKQFTEALAQHQEIMNQVTGAKAEAGRALGSLRIKEAELPQAKVASVLASLPKDAQLKAAQLLSKLDLNDARQVNEFIKEITPSSTPSKIFEFYRNSLLSSPATLIKKVSSDSAMLVMESLAKLIKSGFDKDAKAGESWWFARGAANAVRMIPDVLSGKFNLHDAPEFEPTNQSAIKGTAGKIVRLPSQALSFATNLMYLANLRGELYARGFRQAVNEGLTGTQLDGRVAYLAEHPTADAMDAAHKVALHNTFQAPLGKPGRAITRATHDIPGLRYLIPFVKTPINLAKAGAELSPYGLIKGGIKGDTDLIARGIIGTVLLSALAYEASQDRVTGGGPLDYRKKETLESTNWQSYSIRLHGHYYNFHKLEPFGMFAGLTADIMHGMHAGDPETVSQGKAESLLAHVERNYRDIPFLMTLANAFESLEGNQGGWDKALKFADKQVAGFIPAGIANIAQGIDRTVRRPSGIAETLESRVPGLTSRVPAVLDITGKPVQRPASALGGASPFPVTSESDDPAISELARLGIATQQPPKQVKLGQRTIELSANEREQLTAFEADRLYTQLSRVVSTPYWSHLPDEIKLKAIQRWRADIDRTRPYRLARMRRESGQPLFTAAASQ